MFLKFLEKAFVSYFLPEGLLAHFDIVAIHLLCDIKSKKEFYEICLEKQNEILLAVNASQYESKGFTEVTLQETFRYEANLPTYG